MKYIILDKNLPIDSADRFGNTLLHQAVEEQKVDIVSFLVDQRADVKALNNRNPKQTPLDLARAIGNQTIINLLEKKK